MTHVQRLSKVRTIDEKKSTHHLLQQFVVNSKTQWNPWQGTVSHRDRVKVANLCTITKSFQCRCTLGTPVSLETGEYSALFAQLARQNRKACRRRTHANDPKKTSQGYCIRSGLIIDREASQTTSPQQHHQSQIHFTLSCSRSAKHKQPWGCTAKEEAKHITTHLVR